MGATQRRMISGDIWRDEVISTLNLLGRLLWVGLIVTCADDQGRLINNARLIRSDVFPLDDTPVEQIEDALQELQKGGGLIAYEVGGKAFLQLTHWWKYQSPSWAAPSRYPAPPEWNDRVKIHKGSQIYTENWNIPGGFAPQPKPLRTRIPIGIPNRPAYPGEEGEVKEEVQEKDKEREEEQPARDTHPDDCTGFSSKTSNPAATASAMIQFGEIPDLDFAEKVYCETTGYTTIPPSIRDAATDLILSLRSRFPSQEDLVAHLKPVYSRWCSTRGKSGKTYSRLGCGWLEWALEDPNTPPDQTSGKARSGIVLYSEEEIKAMQEALH